MEICMRLLVSGRVQGVFFRASTQQQAEQLSLTGYARNLADGRVEVIACGELSAVEKLEAWLSQGPELADVSTVVTEILPMQKFSEFSTG